MNSITEASVGDLSSLISSFLRSLRAANKSPTTIATDGEAAKPAPGLPAGVWDAHGGLSDHQGARRDIHRAARCHQGPRHSQQSQPAPTALFNFLVDWGEITVSPMAKMKPPKVRRFPSRSSPTTTVASSRFARASGSRTVETWPS
jgi:hypothetical protein